MCHKTTAERSYRALIYGRRGLHYSCIASMCIYSHTHKDYSFAKKERREGIVFVVLALPHNVDYTTYSLVVRIHYTVP